MLKLSDTNRLLLHCIQLKASQKTRAEIEKLIRQPLDWKAFEEAALWHGVAPLAFNGLRTVEDRQRLPSGLFIRLKSEYKKNLIRNTIHFAELEKIKAGLEAQQISAIPLKGAAITRMIYKDIGLRPMSDIDILVKKKDILVAVQAMESIGYHRQDHKNRDQHLNSTYHIVCFNPGTRVLLEIHWDISSNRKPSWVRSNASPLMDKWWRRACNADDGYTNILHLDPVDSICLVAAHFFKHRFLKANTGFSTNGSLLQLCDLFNIVDYYQDVIDWNALRSESQRMERHGFVSVALWVVKILFGEFIEDAGCRFFLELDIAPSDKTIAEYVAKRICPMKDRQEPTPLGLIRISDSSSSLGRFFQFAREVFPAPATLSLKLNKPIDSNRFYLNYISRPFGLIQRYGRLLMNRRHLREERLLKQWIDGIAGNDSSLS